MEQVKNNVIPRNAVKIVMQALTGCNAWNEGETITAIKDEFGWHFRDEKNQRSWYLSPSFMRNGYYFKFINVIR